MISETVKNLLDDWNGKIG
jgi:LPS O-antigen subunit length determinant protein (WzzB/FepE family)